MKNKSIEVSIAHPVPNVSSDMEDSVIQVWAQAQEALQRATFKVEDPFGDKLDVYQLTMDFSQVQAILAEAKQVGFSEYRQRVLRSGEPVNRAVIAIQLEVEQAPEQLLTFYHAAGVALQQLFLALNIAVPGSCQILQAQYMGSECSSFDPPALEASPFVNAYLSSVDTQWPTIKALGFQEVWQWFEKLEVSETEIALQPVTKVLFGLLELSQAQSELNSRDALLVSHLLELLTDMEEMEHMGLLKSRVKLILGEGVEEGDSLAELYRMKHDYVLGERPIRRPTLKLHDPEEELVQQLRVHNSPVEEGIAIVLSILQVLCATKGCRYRFDESVTVEGL